MSFNYSTSEHFISCSFMCLDHLEFLHSPSLQIVHIISFPPVPTTSFIVLTESTYKSSKSSTQNPTPSCQTVTASSVNHTHRVVVRTLVEDLPVRFKFLASKLHNWNPTFRAINQRQWLTFDPAPAPATRRCGGLHRTSCGPAPQHVLATTSCRWPPPPPFALAAVRLSPPSAGLGDLGFGEEGGREREEWEPRRRLGEPESG